MKQAQEYQTDLLRQLLKANGSNPKSSTPEAESGLSGTAKILGGTVILGGLAAAGAYAVNQRAKRSKAQHAGNAAKVGGGVVALTAAATAWYLDWHHRPVNWISNLLGKGDYYPSAATESPEISSEVSRPDASEKSAIPRALAKDGRPPKSATLKSKDRLMAYLGLAILALLVVGAVVYYVWFSGSDDDGVIEDPEPEDLL